jgi:hypothetical protein
VEEETRNTSYGIKNDSEEEADGAEEGEESQGRRIFFSNPEKFDKFIEINAPADRTSEVSPPPSKNSVFSHTFCFCFSGYFFNISTKYT